MAPAGFDVAPTVGALEIGILFAVALFGAVSVQVALYYTRFPSDSYFLKCLVALVWSLDCAHTIALCNAIYILTIIQYGHPELLAHVPDSLNLTIILSGFIGPLEQGWFAYRLYKFSSSWYLPAFCCLLSTARTCGSVIVGIIAYSGITVTAFIQDWGWIMEICLVIGAVTDILLVIGLCYYLKSWRGDGLDRMNRLVNRLMQWSIESGLITSIGAIFLLICFVTMKDNFNWIGVSAILPKLFSNSLLFSLNARKPLLHLAPEELKRRGSAPHSVRSTDLLTSEVHQEFVTPFSPLTPAQIRIDEVHFKVPHPPAAKPSWPDMQLQSFSAVSHEESTDPLTSETRVDDIHFRVRHPPAAKPSRSDMQSFSAVSLHNSYTFPPGDGMPTFAV